MTNLPSLRTFLRHHKALDKSPFCVNPVVANYCLFSIVGNNYHSLSKTNKHRSPT